MTNEKKLWKVVDMYEGYELLGYVDTKREALKLAHERADDTDGECYIVFRKLEDDGLYHIVKED